MNPILMHGIFFLCQTGVFSFVYVVMLILYYCQNTFALIKIYKTISKRKKKKKKERPSTFPELATTGGAEWVRRKGDNAKIGACPPVSGKRLGWEVVVVLENFMVRLKHRCSDGLDFFSPILLENFKKNYN